MMHQPKPREPYEVYTLKLDDLTLQISYFADPYNTRKTMDEAIDHFEIRSVDETGKSTRQQHPMSETGYYSWFLNRGFMEDHDSPREFITKALEYHAQQKPWLDHLEKAKQLSLF